MASFFKKKVKANDIGLILYGTAINMTEEEMKGEDINDILSNYEVDKGRAKDELLFLRLFTVDFTVTSLVKDTPKMNAILGSFHNAMNEVSREMGDEVGKAFSEDLKSRFSIYQKAVVTPHHKGPSWTVGDEFAKLCGGEDNLFILMLGSLAFTSSIAWASKLLKSFRIKLQ